MKLQQFTVCCSSMVSSASRVVWISCLEVFSVRIGHLIFLSSITCSKVCHTQNSLMITPHPTEGVMPAPPQLLTLLNVTIYIEVPVVWESEIGARCFKYYQVAGLLVGFDLDLKSLNVALNVPHKGTFSRLSWTTLTPLEQSQPWEPCSHWGEEMLHALSYSKSAGQE